MKKKLAIAISLILVVALSSTAFIFAESGVYGKTAQTSYKVKFQDASGKDLDPSTGYLGSETTYAKNYFEGVEKIGFSFKGTANTEYMVFLLTPNEDGSQATAPTDKNVIYIDQLNSGEDGNISFTIYPSSLPKNGVYNVCISGTGINFASVGTFSVGNWQKETDFTLGDINNDGIIDAVDALAVLQQFVNSSTLSGNQLKAAKVKGNEEIDPIGALKILKRFVGEIDSF